MCKKVGPDFKKGDKVFLDDSYSATVISYYDDSERYLVMLDNGSYEIAYPSQLEEMED